MGNMSGDILIQTLWFFLLYSILGWCLEVVYNSANTGEFVNRGFLNGAVCPIYGFGAVLLIMFLQPVEDNLFSLFFGSAAIASLLELLGGFLLGKLFHTSWWDYSEEPFNLGGYICLKFSLAWGVAGVVLMRVIHPLVHKFVLIIPQNPGHYLLAGFYILLLADLAITTLTIRKLNRDLREITHIAEILRKSSDSLAENLGNTALLASQKLRELELAEKKQKIADQINLAVDESRRTLNALLEENKMIARLESLLNKRSLVRSRLLRAFPNMRNRHDNKALIEIKNRLKRRKKTSKSNHK